MKSKRIIFVIALAVFLLFSANSFAAIYINAEVLWIKQNDNGIQISFLTQGGYQVVKTVDAPGLEKNFLAIALTAQTSGMNVDLEVIGDYITMIRIVSP
jgi:hypothetical protein